MKRVKAACIFQTLVFSQKDDCGLSAGVILECNSRELDNYKRTLERSHTRYRITSQEEQADGSIVVRVRKQYNDKADVSEYFD